MNFVFYLQNVLLEEEDSSWKMESNFQESEFMILVVPSNLVYSEILILILVQFKMETGKLTSQ